MSIRFFHTLIYEVVGIGGLDDELVLLDESEEGLWACVTREPGAYCRDADEDAAVGRLLLRGITGEGSENSGLEKLDEEVERVRSSREERTEGRAYLVLRREGAIPDWDPRAERAVGDIVIRMFGSPKEEIKEETQDFLSTLALSISIATDHTLKLIEYANAVVFYGAGEEKIFAKALTGNASATVVRSLRDDFPDRAQDIFRKLADLSDLSRVFRLFTASLESSDDRFRAFHAGWAALEIFVNKVFASHYKERFFDDLESDKRPEAHSHYVDRIRKVMNGRYRLRDRFALVAATLAPDDADTDFDRFTKAKSVRDDLMHGRDVEDNSLPVVTVQALLRRYSVLHAEAVKNESEDS